MSENPYQWHSYIDRVVDDTNGDPTTIPVDSQTYPSKEDAIAQLVEAYQLSTADAKHLADYWWVVLPARPTVECLRLRPFIEHQPRGLRD